MVQQNSRASQLKLSWLYLAWLSLIFTTVVIGAIGVAVQGDPEPVVLNWGIGGFAIFAISLHAIGMVAAVGLLYLLLRRNGLNWRAVGLKGSLSLLAIGYVALAVLVAFFLYPVLEGVLGAVGLSMHWRTPRASPIHLTSAFDIVLTLLAAVLIAPVTEEIIFRGYILTAFVERKCNSILAVLLSAMIFASIHIYFGPGMLVYIFLWSWIPAFLYLKFDTLYPAVLFHLLNNAIAYVILPLVGM